jgi:hypothetical protein
MTNTSDTERCSWCHRPLELRPGAGRPRLFCSRSHRQRAYEARRRADQLHIPPDQSIVATSDLRTLHDRLYRLEAAVDDVRADLVAPGGTDDYRLAYEHLMDAVVDLVGTVVEPVRH